jgi:hypothetical protein
MTATRTAPTLHDIAAIHEAAAAGKPSRIYRAGGVLPAKRWAEYAAHPNQSKLQRECGELAAIAEVYGLAGDVVETVDGPAMSAAPIIPLAPVALHSPLVDAVRIAAEQAGWRVVLRARRARDLARTIDSLTVERATHRQAASCCVARRGGRCRRLNEIDRAISRHDHDYRRLLRRLEASA